MLFVRRYVLVLWTFTVSCNLLYVSRLVDDSFSTMSHRESLLLAVYSTMPSVAASSCCKSSYCSKCTSDGNYVDVRLLWTVFSVSVSVRAFTVCTLACGNSATKPNYCGKKTSSAVIALNVESCENAAILGHRFIKIEEKSILVKYTTKHVYMQ